MDDLSRQLDQLLSDPESMKQLRDMMGALGLSGPQAEASPPGQSTPPGPDPAALSGLLSSLGGAPSQEPAAPENAFGGLSPELLQLLSRAAPLLGKLGQEDDSIRLLRALRPLLSPPRQQKLDEAVRLLRMMRLAPLLKDSGLLAGLPSGL